MNLHFALIILHVLAAVLGTGCVVAVVIRARSGGDGAVADLRRLLACVSIGLVTLLVTGGLALRVSGIAGIYLHMWWLRISIALFLVLGAAIGYARRQLRRPGGSLAAVEQVGWLGCALVTVLVVLMEAKPW